MAAIFSAAVANALRRRNTQDEPMEPDPDERELRMFEHNCRLLNTKHFSGLQRLQVETWLLFEDQKSSVYAMWTQTVLLMLIVFSTGLILVQSYLSCKYVFTENPETGVSYLELPYEQLSLCDNLTSPVHLTISCTRVCAERLDWFEEGGPIHFFVMDAVCIGVFTLEFVLRLAASPATIGLNTFLCSAFNWIDVIAIAPFYVDVLLTVAQADTGGGLKSLAVLRIVRLARVLRVLKFSKSISWVMVLIRTVYKSLSAMVLIIAVSLIM